MGFKIDNPVNKAKFFRNLSIIWVIWAFQRKIDFLIIIKIGGIDAKRNSRRSIEHNFHFAEMFIVYTRRDSADI
jgi:hypothetical protein